MKIENLNERVWQVLNILGNEVDEFTYEINVNYDEYFLRILIDVPEKIDKEVTRSTNKYLKRTEEIREVFPEADLVSFGNTFSREKKAFLSILFGIDEETKESEKLVSAKKRKNIIQAINMQEQELQKEGDTFEGRRYSYTVLYKGDIGVSYSVFDNNEGIEYKAEKNKEKGNWDVFINEIYE